MKNITKFIITALLLFCTDLWAQEHVGFLKKVSGDVEIQRGDSFVNAHKGLKLMNADVLIAGSNGYAGIVLQMEPLLPLVQILNLTSETTCLSPMLRPIISQCILKKGLPYTIQEKLESFLQHQ